MRKHQETKTKVLWPQFFYKNLELSLECVLCSSQCSGQDQAYSSCCIHMPLWKNMFSSCAACHPVWLAHHVWLALWLYNLLMGLLLNPQSTNCLELWIKLTGAWAFSFSLPHLLAPFSRVPPPLTCHGKHTMTGHGASRESTTTDTHVPPLL